MPIVRKDFVISSSSLGRLEQCPAAGVFRQTTKEKPSFPQWYGIFVGRFLQYAVERGREAALAYVYTKKMKGVHNVCERIDTDALPVGRCEVGLAHDVIRDRGRELLPGARSNDLDVYSEQYGRADLLGELEGGVSLIVDYKMGDISELNPAEFNQLLGLAAALRGAQGRSPAGYALALAQIRSTGHVDWAVSRVDDAHLDRYAERARLVHLRVLEDREHADSGRSIDFVPGAECTWCELRPDCPAWPK
jgi:hypothetical protein